MPGYSYPRLAHLSPPHSIRAHPRVGGAHCWGSPPRGGREGGHTCVAGAGEPGHTCVAGAGGRGASLLGLTTEGGSEIGRAHV